MLLRLHARITRTTRTTSIKTNNSNNSKSNSNSSSSSSNRTMESDERRWLEAFFVLHWEKFFVVQLIIAVLLFAVNIVLFVEFRPPPLCNGTLSGDLVLLVYGGFAQLTFWYCEIMEKDYENVTTTAAAAAATATMHIAIDLAIAVLVPLGSVTRKQKWNWLSAIQFSIAACLVGLNIVLFVHHSTPTVDQLMTADLAFLVNGTFFQVFWISECWGVESKSWSYWTLVVGLVNDGLAIANTACAIKKAD
ncbi:hypothetical protein BCON_0028g00420 [Botryotinia convoluta]|uniref:Uncharacterized protein n=1 Tax=Botryotinia convoluta TaxID=54673 RepID=A0A4Z1IIU2_9HELO|nr:hypothetical protein BCON_0028g00420 [Botryotinia convoluta]